MGISLFAPIFHRAFPNSVPRNKALKKLFRGLAMNSWCSMEEDVYLETSALGSAVVTMNNFVVAAGV